MYIISNESGVHGAAALFYPDVQEKIADAVGDITEFDIKVVDSLPATGVKGISAFQVTRVNPG